MAFRKLAIVMAATLLSHLVAAETITTLVGKEHHQCRVHLHLPKNLTADGPLILDQMGTGTYQRESMLFNPPAQRFFDSGKACVLTIDKPGIRRKPGAPNDAGIGDLRWIEINENDLLGHTQDDLLQCLYFAIEWALAQRPIGTDRQLVLIGHSEGAQLHLRLIQRLLQEKSPILGRIQSILLSGVYLDPWDQLFQRQHSSDDLKIFQRSLRTHDPKLMKRVSKDLGLAYWENVIHRGPLYETVKFIEQSNVAPKIYVFQGLDDRDTAGGRS
jgi:hypothetical protein